MKNVLVIIVLIIVVIAIYNVFMYMKQGVSFGGGGVSSLFKLPYNIPKGYQGSISSSPATAGITSTPPPSVRNNSGNGSAQNNTPTPDQPKITPPTGFTIDQISPYYEQVSINGVSPAWSWTAVGQFSLRVDSSLKKGVDITGWRVRSNRGEVLVPQAVQNYDPSGLSLSGDVVLAPGAYAVFYSSASPLGLNLRMNKCIGYLNTTYQFNPSLPSYCPNAYDRSEIATFSGQCQNLIFSLGGCSVPSAAQLNSVSREAACMDYLNRFNYTGCYRKHLNDADFFSNEWRIWIGSPLPLDASHDRLLLFDKNGLLVDQYIY